MQGAEAREFTGTLATGPDGRAYIEVPFDPDEAWGVKERHHVAGTVGEHRWRGPVVHEFGSWRILLGPAWRRDCGIEPGDAVTVDLAPEGPQHESLPPDIAAALDAEPEARAFFESLATFYRKGYLRWMEGSARRPAVREERLKELIALLKAGKKQRDR